MNLQDLPNLFRGLADELEDTLETNKKVAELERALACAQLEIAELKIAQMDCMAKNSDLEQRIAELEAHVSEPVINCEARTTETITITEVTTHDQANQEERFPSFNRGQVLQRFEDCSSEPREESEASGERAESESRASSPLEFLSSSETGVGEFELPADSFEQRVAARREEFERTARENRESLQDFVISVGRRLDDFVEATTRPGTTVDVQAAELPESPGIAPTNQPALPTTTSSPDRLGDTKTIQRPVKPAGKRQPAKPTVVSKRKSKKRRKPKGFAK